MKASTATALALTVAIAMPVAGADDNPARHASLAAALRAPGQGEAVLVELDMISPFDESNLSREYREQRFETLLDQAAYLHAHYLVE